MNVERKRIWASGRGFTLMEMLAVLAIIAILAMMAVPSYMDRIVRQQIEAALPLAEIAKKPVAEAWAQLRVLPADNAAAALPAAEKIVNNYVSSLSIQDGAIKITRVRQFEAKNSVFRKVPHVTMRVSGGFS